MPDDHAYCIIIEDIIDSSICPLSKGNCRWQNSTDNSCKYSSQIKTLAELAIVTGRPVPTQTEIDELVQSVKNHIKSNL